MSGPTARKLGLTGEGEGGETRTGEESKGETGGKRGGEGREGEIPW